MKIFILTILGFNAVGAFANAFIADSICGRLAALGLFLADVAIMICVLMVMP
ncbi:MAG: hypothetical protein WC091_02605 [Sulfuricellaceae bacterium]